MRGSVGVLLLFLAPLIAGRADSKLIRLRGETIVTPAPHTTRAQLQGGRSTDAVSGLYLVQFTGPVQPEWRTAIAERGVRLLRYVPDDAFVANLDRVQLSDLESLAYVHWIGPYEPKHKVHPSLARHLSAAGLGAPVAVKLLTSPALSAVEVALVEKSFRVRTYRRLSPLGAVLGGEVGARELAMLARSPRVLWIEPAPKMQMLDEVSTKIVAGDDFETGTDAVVHKLGYDGRGVTVAVADSGIDSGEAETMHPDLAGRVDAFFAYGGLEHAYDEHSHGTHCAGIVGGNAATGEVDENGALYGLGVAPAAHLVAQRIFDGVGDYYPPESFEKLTRDAVRSGAVVGSNSWGDESQGQYDLSAAEFDALVRDADAQTPGEQPYILEFSAGNSGPGRYTINSPAVSKNVLATGSCDNSRYEFVIYADGPEVTSDFSSRGPCEDGRIKPDIMAPGTWIASLQSQYAGDLYAWSPISAYYLYQGGTSQAGPHAAGAAAVFVQYYRETHGNATPSPALVKAALINSAIDMGVGYVPDDEGELYPVGDTGPVPNMDEGWGRIDLENLIASDRRYRFTEQGAGLQTGQLFEHRVVVSPNDTLKITLVYTDVAGLPAAIPALVNDLDLEVTAPDGRLYRGNAFLNGASVPGTPVGDRLNNVEAVHLPEPLPGEYIVHVRAVNVVEDVHRRATLQPEQDFALVISGDLPNPGEGIVFLDRDVYGAPATALVRLIDQQLAGQPNAQVSVSSTTDPAGETLTLAAGGAPGSFASPLDLVLTSTAVGDGQLQVAHDDVVTVAYFDASPAVTRVAEAQIDLLPPVLTGVGSTNKFGRTTILWSSDESATSTVVFGLPEGATQTLTETRLTQAHRVEIPLLEAGQTNRYYVVSTDRAGNTATNDNQGRWFTFVTTQAATALLLYSPESAWDEGLGGFFGPYPGIENWTIPLDQLGLPYELWNVEERGSLPGMEDLVPFRVVLWRPEEFGEPSPEIKSALTAYLDQGGSLLVCSFDLLSRLSSPSDAAFKSNVLHVASFSEDAAFQGSMGWFAIDGATGDPVGAGVTLDLDYSEFPDATLIGIDWPYGVDHLQNTGDATPCFREALDSGTGGVVGLRFPQTGADSTNRVVFCSFPLEAIPMDVPAPNNRVTFLANALGFLVPGLRGFASVTFDRAAYGIPGAVTVEVTDSGRAGAQQTQMSLNSPSEPGPRTLVLNETVRPGVFRGMVTLVPSETAASAGEIRVRDGDTLEARYVDAVEREALATAAIDTTPPVISLVAVDPAYNEATVTWVTDKPTDALVQFSTAGFPFPFNRTAYSPAYARNHAVQLTGLLPDQQYFFQVLSRDPAGNLAIDNNQGQFYQFRTLKPIQPPWSDDLESGRVGWVVFNDDAAVDDETGENLLNSGWQYGVPRNTEGVTAHSGTRCWATNLEGVPVSLAISDLVSPAVDLTGARQATLRFWHCYDFTERSEWLDIELGQVGISKDEGATWESIYTVVEEFSIGWEQVSIDLSKYAGHVVRFLWNYQMFSFDEIARIGWLIDDITVTADLSPIGLLTVTNNLDQASFALSGPQTILGGGLALRVTNAPTGEYVIRWSPVAFYETPAAQTNTLTIHTPVHFLGAYTFPDTNGNGISDLFEMHYFQTVAQPHPPETDSDRDGASDLAEFVAGTNPTDPASRLEITAVNGLPNRTLRVQWRSVASHAYQLELSTNLVDWLPTSDWMRAAGSISFLTLPPLTGSPEYFFRIRARP